jgi:predicted nucleotidyltransferase
VKKLVYDQNRLDELCRNYYVKRLSVFGSVLRGEDTPDSDLDLLLEFKPESKVGLFGLERLQRELGDVFRRKVDLNTAGFLNRAFRNEVVQNARTIYTG